MSHIPMNVLYIFVNCVGCHDKRLHLWCMCWNDHDSLHVFL